MATIRQLPRADTQSLDTIVIAQGAIYVDTSRNELRLGDGVTPGGIRILSFDQLRNQFLSATDGLGAQVGFPESGGGFLARLVDNTFVLRALTVGPGLEIGQPLGATADPKYQIDTIWLDDLLNGRLATVAELRSRAPNKTFGTTSTFAANEYVALLDTPIIASDLLTGWNFKVAITADRTLGLPSNIVIQSGLYSIQASLGPRLITLAAGWLDPQGLFPISLLTNQRVFLNYFVTDTLQIVISGAIVV